MNAVRKVGFWAGMATGALLLAGCHSLGPATNATSKVVAVEDATGHGNRWIAYSPGEKESWKGGLSSYAEMAFGPGQGEPVQRDTLLAPASTKETMAQEYLPVRSTPLFTAKDLVADGQGHHYGVTHLRVPAVYRPSDHYYVNGQDLGPSHDRAGAGVPVDSAAH